MPRHMPGIDLHVHTTCSDGTLSPSEAVRLAAERGNPEEAARLFGASDALRAAIGDLRPTAERKEDELKQADVRNILGDAAFSAAWNAGHALSREAAIALALDKK